MLRDGGRSRAARGRLTQLMNVKRHPRRLDLTGQRLVGALCCVPERPRERTPVAVRNGVQKAESALCHCYVTAVVAEVLLYVRRVY